MIQERKVPFPNRRRVIKTNAPGQTDGNFQADITLEEGVPTQEGTLITADLLNSMAKKGEIILRGTTTTAAATVIKEVTAANVPANYVPVAGDMLAVTYVGVTNTAAAAASGGLQLRINGTVAANARQVRVNGALGTAAASNGALHVVAGGTAVYYFDGTFWQQQGSAIITNTGDTTDVQNIIGGVANQYRIAANHVHTQLATPQTATQNYNPFVGFLADGTIDKITLTGNNTTTAQGPGTGTGAGGMGPTDAGVRRFTTNPINLFETIMFMNNTTGAWVAGGLNTNALFSRRNIGAATWKNAIGQIWDNTITPNVLRGNDFTFTANAGPTQREIFVGGTRQGNFFVPLEFSIGLPATPRANVNVYKRIGYFFATATATVPSYYHSEYQKVFVRENNAWIALDTQMTTPSQTPIYVAANEASALTYSQANPTVLVLFSGV